MYKRVLVPLDGSPASETILPVVRALVRQHNAAVTLLRVAPRRAEAEAREYLRARATELDATGVACEVRRGPVARAIRACAEETRAELIAMCTSGREGFRRMVLGSVADSVLRRGRLPVLLVRAEGMQTKQFRLRRILAPVDGSAQAESGLLHAQRLARAFDAEVLVLSVWDSMGYRLGSFPENELEMKKQEEHAKAKFYIIEATHRLQAGGARVHWKLLSGPVSQCILDTAKVNSSDLIVMATHGATGITRIVEGSIAGEVLRDAKVPVLIVRAP